tara:strand:- start:929 stop:3469 length:2541 start_codon:yes stop_codon:yes gene_type:complete
MKRILLSLLLTFGIITISLGKSIDIATAKKVAGNYLNVSQSSLKNQIMDISTLSFNKKSANTTNENSLYYIFNSGTNNGFIIIAGDDNSTPVLGFTHSGSFDKNNLPPNFRKWLEGYKKELNYIIDNNIKATTEIKNEWTTLKNSPNMMNAKAASVNPLLTTTWNQSPYYNSLCPGGSVTGCVATAMAQIMNYWEYPTQGTGFHSYTEDDYGTLSANFGSTVYQWASMPNNVTSSNNAVATLMYHCGVSVDMNYSPQSSGAAGAVMVAPALKDYFSYPSSTSVADRNNYTQVQWIQLLKTELDAGRPMYYEGIGTGGGHAFVCDGYDNNDYFHFNWGWGGQADGYFIVSSLNPGSTGTGGGSGGYNTNQKIVKGIEPPIGAQTFDMQLYDNVTPSNSTIYYGQSFDISTNIANFGGNTFDGDYTVAIFDNSYNFIEYVETLSGYTLQSGNAYTNNLTFSTTAILGMLPGTYYAGVFFRPTGGNWQLVADGSYSNLVQMTVINPNDIELNSAMIITPSNILIQGQSASVNFNIVNNGASTFIGEYMVGLYNLDGTFAQTIATFVESNGLLSGYTYQSPFLTFNTTAITANPGTYLLAVQHNPNNIGWQLTGSSNFQNPVYVTVTAPPILADIYESNNTESTAYDIPTNFTANNTTILTVGSNSHTGSDYDYYSVNLASGYDYTITTRVHDSYNSGNSQTYTNDVLWSYSVDGNWSNAIDDVMSSNISVSNGGTVNFQVAPYFQGETGTYLLDIQISRLVISEISEVNINNGFSVFPNPTSDYLNITNSSNQEIESILITDISGKIMKQCTPSINFTKISVHDLSKGTYFVIIHSKNKKWQQKFIKYE